MTFKSNFFSPFLTSNLSSDCKRRPSEVEVVTMCGEPPEPAIRPGAKTETGPVSISGEAYSDDNLTDKR